MPYFCNLPEIVAQVLKINYKRNINALFTIVFAAIVLHNYSYAKVIENDTPPGIDTLNETSLPAKTNIDTVDPGIDSLLASIDTLEPGIDSLETNIDTVDSQSDSLDIGIDSTITRIDSINLNRTKAEFILEIASQIIFPETVTDSVYKIGIHGRGREIRELFHTLEEISDSLTIQERPIEVYYYRNTRAIQPVDLLYINGNSKLRIRDLNKKLEGYPYFIITENFPFGTSLLNFTVDERNEMQFELQDKALTDKGAKITPGLLESPNRILLEEKWEKILENTKQQLALEKFRSEKQVDIIVEQKEEIVEQEKLIFNQQIIIVSTIAFITILTILVLIIIRLSKQRKEALLVVKQKNKDITDSIRYAKYIQEAMLPPSERIANAFSDSFVLYLPKDIISGDFYWFKDLGPMKMIGVADCTGHGVPGAFLSIIGNELLSLFAESLGDMNPGELLELIDRRITQSLNQESSQRADGMDMALISYNPEEGMINYAGAYRPLIMVRNNELTVFKATRSSVGGISHKQTKRFPNTQFKALPGDCYYMFSDGYPDQFGGYKKKKFMSRRLNNLLHEIHHLPMDQQKEKLLQNYLDWKGSEEQVDDVSIVGIRI